MPLASGTDWRINIIVWGQVAERAIDFTLRIEVYSPQNPFERRSRSRIVTIIVARERHWSSEEGPQIHSKGGEVKTPSKSRGPFEFLPLPYCA